MRRTILTLVGFALATTVLIGLKSTSAAALLGWSAEAPLVGDPSLGADGGPAQSTGAGSSSPGSSASASANGSPSPGAAPGPSSSSRPATTGPAPTTAAPPPPANRTILGPAVATTLNGSNFGTTQVQIVVTGTHIDDIVAVKQSNRPGNSASTLRAQALAAQSANIGNVSGATASSNAYKQSLQGAINQI